MAQVETNKKIAKDAKKVPAKTSKPVTKKIVNKQGAAKKAPVQKNPTKKTVVKKENSKKIVKKQEDVETIVKTDFTSTEKVRKEVYMCKYCYKDINIGSNICPNCHKTQKDDSGIIVIAVLSIILILSIIGNHFIQKYIDENNNKGIMVIAYEDLVRSANEYLNTEVGVKGSVVSVDGADVTTGNLMVVKINTNLFDMSSEQFVRFEFLDEGYEQGLLPGDIITVFGIYTSLDGNTPFIRATTVEFDE